MSYLHQCYLPDARLILPQTTENDAIIYYL